jgi:hypothetical protein
MIIFDLRLVRFDILAERWPSKAPFKVTHERAGEVLVDVFRFRLMLTNHRRLAAL